MPTTFPFCCYLSRWVVIPLCRGHVKTINLKKYLHYRSEPSLFTNLTHLRKERRIWRNWPASTCAQIKLSAPMPDHKERSSPKVSWKLGSSEMTLSTCCLGDCCNVSESAVELCVFYCWPPQREGQGQQALKEPILCGILIWTNMFTH